MLASYSALEKNFQTGNIATEMKGCGKKSAVYKIKKSHGHNQSISTVYSTILHELYYSRIYT